MSKNIKINFELPDGRFKEVDAVIGQSVMQSAIFNNIEGIDAECGGSCMCATCHIYVPDSVCVDAASEDESEMLEETAAERTHESRLSCQLIVSAEMDGALFKVPECQS